nr:integrase, catalytic region, zinc finger, CCHC-type, peptidase aspartic, catalytic [Tanacetum cinerariifolium]
MQVIQIVLWYLDSGCSKHMTGDRSQLTNFVNKFLGTVKFGNDHVAKIIGYGDYQIGNITISRVYYIEGLRHNLFSVGQFCDSKLEVAFRQHTCFILKLEDVDLLTGSRGNNMYTLSLRYMMASSPICLLSKASKTKSWVWHRRLSHLYFGTINHLARHGLVRGLPKLNLKKDHMCSACAMGKSKKKPHKPKSEDTNQEKLYLLHMDLCGLMRVTSVNEKKTRTSCNNSYNNQFKGLVLNPPPSTSYVPPSRFEWNILFQPLFDQLLIPPSSVDLPAPEVIAPIAKVVALEPVVSTGSPSSTTVNQDAPSPSNSQTTPGTQAPLIFNDVEEENHDLDVAHINNVLFFGILILENDSKSSSSDVIPIVLYTAAPNSEHVTKWTKDHPLDNIIGELKRPVSTRLQLYEQALFCCFDAFLLSAEPNNYKDSLTQACWIEAMGLWYPKDSFIALIAYADADHVGCQDTKQNAYKTYYDLATRKAIPKPKYTKSDNDGDDFVHPKLSTFYEEKRQDEEDKEVEGSHMKVQTPFHFESTDDEAYDEVTQGDIDEEEKLDEEKTNKKEANELYNNVNIDLEGRNTEMTYALLANSSSVSSGFISNMLNPTPDACIDSILNLNTESTSLVDVPVTTNDEIPSSSVTTLPPLCIPLIHPLQQTPLFTPTIAPSTSMQNLPTFGSLFKFEDRVKSIEDDFSKFKQTNLFTKAVLLILGIVDTHLANKMNEAIKIVVQLQSDRLRDEAQPKNEHFINKLDENIKKIIKEQVKVQVKDQVFKIFLRIEKLVNEQLETEVLTRLSNKAKTSHAVATNLFELEMKKILIDKMENVEMMRMKMKNPPPDQTGGPREEELKKNLNKRKEDPRETFNELMDTPLDFLAFMLNRLNVDTLTPNLLAGPTFELMKGSCKSLVELEYFHEEVCKATTDQLDWNSPKGHQYPHDLLSRESARDVYSRNRIIAIKKLLIVKWHNYKHLEWITAHRDDDKLYTFKEGDYNKLRLQDIKDMLILLVQAYSNPIGFIYQSQDKKNRLIHIDEIHKFSDGTLNNVRSALDDTLKKIRMKYLPQTIWRRVDRERVGAMI